MDRDICRIVCLVLYCVISQGQFSTATEKWTCTTTTELFKSPSYTELEARVIDLEEKLKRLENSKATAEVHGQPTVAFKARSSANINVQSGQTIIFPVIIMNVGKGYDSASGVFTAPVNGTYLFTTAFCLINGHGFSFAIMVDGNQQSVSTFYGNGNNGCQNAESNAVLTAGQKVWVQVLPSSNTGVIITHDGSRWNMFSGTLANS